jgi:hypothetical protein
LYEQLERRLGQDKLKTYFPIGFPGMMIPAINSVKTFNPIVVLEHAAMIPIFR